MLDKFNDWLLYKELPEGWVFDEKTGSPLTGYKFATDGKSIINGGKRALVLIQRQHQKDNIYQAIQQQEKKEIKPIDKFTRKAMNELARSKAKEKLLKDICVDLHICMIEGWDTSQYAADLHDLISSVYESISPAQGELFKCN